MINSAAQITTGWLHPQRVAQSVRVHSLNFDKLCDNRCSSLCLHAHYKASSSEHFELSQRGNAQVLLKIKNNNNCSIQGVPVSHDSMN